MTISDKKLQELIDYTPHEGGQDKLIEATGREFVAVCGRRWGKSNVCAYLALRMLLKPNTKTWIVAPTYDLTQKVFEYLIKFLHKIDPSGKAFKVSRRPFPTIDGRQTNGSLLECKSAENPKSLLGEELDLIIVDEAARMYEEIYQAYLVPTTSSRLGQIVFISTPKGKNWFYHKFNEVGEDNRLTAPSISNTHFAGGGDNAKHEWERLQKLLPVEVFNQEYNASFLDGATSVFKENDIIRCVDENALKDYEPGHFYVIGVDLAKFQDFTVITVLDQMTNRVVYIERQQKVHYPFQKERIKAITERYGRARVIIDSTGVGEPIYDDLQQEGLVIDDYKFTNASKEKLVDKLRIYIQEHNLSLPDDKVLLDELRAFSLEYTPSGKIIYAAPQGQHDDSVISLSLAVWGLTGTRVEPRNALKEQLRKPKRIDSHI